MALRIVAWNIKRLADSWRLLAADPSIDVALLQEATPPPADVRCEVEPPRDSECRWTMPGWTKRFRTAVARFSDRVTLSGRRTADLSVARDGVLPVSRVGTLAVADVEHEGERLTCVSAYAPWENMLHEPARQQPTIFSDGSAHRLVSDLSPLLVNRRQKILVAGDFNMLHGYGEDGSEYWAERYATVFSRMRALGFRFVGPQAPNGRQADPWPTELPRESKNVPTFHSTRQSPATAMRQLDFVFASDAIAGRVHVRALNGVEEWGPSDHCRVLIDVARP